MFKSNFTDLCSDELNPFNAREHAEEIICSTTDSSDADTSKVKLCKKPNKSLSKKRKRNTKPLRNISNLDVRKLDVKHNNNSNFKNSPMLPRKLTFHTFNTGDITTPFPVISNVKEEKFERQLYNRDSLFLSPIIINREFSNKSNTICGQKARSKSPILCNRKRRLPLPIMCSQNPRITSPILCSQKPRTPSPIICSQKQRITSPILCSQKPRTPSPIICSQKPRITSPILCSQKSRTPSPILCSQKPRTPSPILCSQKSRTPSPILCSQKPNTPSPILCSQKLRTPSPILCSQKPRIPSPIRCSQKPRIPSPILCNQKPRIPSPILCSQAPSSLSPVLSVSTPKERSLSPVGFRRKSRSPSPIISSSQASHVPYSLNLTPYSPIIKSTNNNKESKRAIENNNSYAWKDNPILQDCLKRNSETHRKDELSSIKIEFIGNDNTMPSDSMNATNDQRPCINGNKRAQEMQTHVPYIMFRNKFSSSNSEHSINDTPTPKDNCNVKFSQESKISVDIELVKSLTQKEGDLRLSSENGGSSLSPDLQQISFNTDRKDPTKKKYRKGGLAHRLDALLKKRKVNISLRQHESYLSAKTNFIIPKEEFLSYAILNCKHSFECYLVTAIDVRNDKKFVIVINDMYVNNCVLNEGILNLYKPYTIIPLKDKDYDLIVNISHFKCIPVKKEDNL